MKNSNFLSAFWVAACFSFFTVACNSSGDKNAEGTNTDSTAATVQEPLAPVKPSNIMIVTHKVADYAKWVAGYEAHDSMRQAYGLHNALLCRGTKDSNTVMVVVTMDDINKAKEFAALPDLKAAMKKAGVMGAPTFSYLDMQMLDTAVKGPSRLLVTHKVKDWDAWKKVFDGNKPTRVAAGLGDRALGHSIGDNHMVTIAFAVSDMKKAEDFTQSAELKKIMEEAGVEGPPTFFYYTVVKSY